MGSEYMYNHHSRETYSWRTKYPEHHSRPVQPEPHHHHHHHHHPIPVGGVHIGINIGAPGVGLYMNQPEMYPMGYGTCGGSKVANTIANVGTGILGAGMLASSLFNIFGNNKC